MQIAVLLVLGAIVNIAVAWGCALWSQVRVENPSHDRLMEGWNRVRDKGWPDNPESVTQQTGIGINIDWMNTFEDIAGTATAKAWWLVRISTGWPFLSLEGYEQRQGIWPPMPPARFVGCLRLDVPSFLVRSGTPLERLMPFALLWPGFAINTAFYAIMIWLLLFFVPGKVRRAIRRRRGLCPACAYPIGISPLCTECGKPVSPKTSKQVSGP